MSHRIPFRFSLLLAALLQLLPALSSRPTNSLCNELSALRYVYDDKVSSVYTDQKSHMHKVQTKLEADPPDYSSPAASPYTEDEMPCCRAAERLLNEGHAWILKVEKAEQTSSSISYLLPEECEDLMKDEEGKAEAGRRMLRYLAGKQRALVDGVAAYNEWRVLFVGVVRECGVEILEEKRKEEGLVRQLLGRLRREAEAETARESEEGGKAEGDDEGDETRSTSDYMYGANGIQSDREAASHATAGGKEKEHL